MSRPLAVDRHGQILQALEAQGSVSVSDLAERFNVSMETIRRDLKLLAEEGRLVTVHGGAHRLSNEPSLSRRTIENAEGKAAIGRAAAELVEDGMAILIDSGSTTLALAQALTNRSDLTVLTNSLPIGLLLARTKTIKTVLLGGEIEPNDEAAFGLDTLDLIAKYRVDLAFIGAGGISETGEFTDFTRLAAEQRARMAAAAKAAYVLADHTKFSKRTPVPIPIAPPIAGLITDGLPKGEPAAEAAARLWPIRVVGSKP
ncbi:MAG: DeoR/GlpR family DNA-binding transcription regulator [Alphaproteobacteria bacterium]